MKILQKIMEIYQKWISNHISEKLLKIPLIIAPLKILPVIKTPTQKVFTHKIIMKLAVFLLLIMIEVMKRPEYLNR